MRFTCQQDELAHGLQIVAKGLAQRSTLPILTGILLTAEKDRLWARSTDLEIAVECIIPASVNTPGKVLVGGKTLTEFVRRLPPGPVEVSLDDTSNTIRVDSAKSNIQMPLMESDEFPTLPTPSDGVRLRLVSARLREVIRQTIFATISEDSRPFLSSLLWETEQERIRVVATDINRLSLCQVATEATGEARVLIPVRAMREVTGIFPGDEEESVEILISNKQAFFNHGGVTFTTRLMEAEFPQYEQVIPKNFNTEMIVDRESLHNGLERASLVTDTVRMTVNGGMLYLRGDDSVMGQTFEELSVMATGEDIQIVFSPQYILDFLKAVAGEKVRFSFTGPTDRALIRPVESDDYQYIVMPFQVNL